VDQPAFDVEALIAEVAKRHKILLAPEDPAFALLTLNELVLSRYVTLLEARLAGMESALGQISTKQIEVAKSIGENIITAAAAYVAQRLEEANFPLLDRALNANNDGATREFRAAIFLFVAIAGAFLTGFAAIGVASLTPAFQPTAPKSAGMVRHSNSKKSSKGAATREREDFGSETGAPANSLFRISHTGGLLLLS
jgi:hypothetical protein